MENRETEIRATFAKQAVWCRRLGSPLTALVVECLGAGLDHSSASGRRVLTWEGNTDAMGDSVPLRFAGALNGLVRAGKLPDLAQYYPPADLPDPAIFTAAILRAVKAADAEILGWLAYAPQTNEVARSGVLFAGMSVIAQKTGLPLALYEVGASAGLNLIADRYSYNLGGVLFGTQGAGTQGAGVQLAPEWTGQDAPYLTPEIVARKGCDLSPLNVQDPGHRARLLAYIWPDQAARLQRVEAALDLARETPPEISNMGAADWVEREILEAPASGKVRVLLHSIAFQYFPQETQARIAARMAAAGARATEAAPLAWLAFEQNGEAGPQLTLRLWPGNQRIVLANADAHVRKVDWLYRSD